MWNLLRFWLFHRTVKVICVYIFNCVPQILYSICYFHAIFFFSRNSAFSEMCTKITCFVSVFNLFYQTCMYYCKAILFDEDWTMNNFIFNFAWPPILFKVFCLNSTSSDISCVALSFFWAALIFNSFVPPL